MGSLKRKALKSRKKYLLQPFLLFIISIVIGTHLGSWGINVKDVKISLPRFKSAEIKKIIATQDIKEKAYWDKKLIEKVGPVQAQEDFQHSGVPYNGQMHLLNHTVGDYIYKKYGPSGITMCKDYFSSSCFHGFIIRGIGNGNLKNVDAMMNACRKQGREAFDQCSHALGHGFLAWLGYPKLLDALHVCDAMAGRVNEFDASYCHNGVFMENLWGLHEGKPSADRWIKASDKYYPCNDPRIAEKYLPGCWYNQAFHLMNNVYDGDHVRVAFECEKVIGKDNRYMCFDGVFRSINNMTGKDIPLKYKTCSKMPKGWNNECILIVLSASYQQGDHELPLKICDYTSNLELKKSCFKKAYQMINAYDSRVGRRDFCLKIPKEYRGQCPG
jgi:hypothetical protein